MATYNKKYLKKDKFVKVRRCATCNKPLRIEHKSSLCNVCNDRRDNYLFYYSKKFEKLLQKLEQNPLEQIPSEQTPKTRFEELKRDIEYKKSELAKKGKHAQFDFRIKVLEAEMKGIAETMDYIYESNKNKE